MCGRRLIRSGSRVDASIWLNNMKGNTKAKTPTQYISELVEPRKSHIKQLHKLVREAAPGLKAHIHYGMLAYGPMKYKTKSGLEGDWFVIGLASQKSYISMYFSCEEDGRYLAESYKKKLPKANIGKSCVRFKTPDDVDLKVLKEMIQKAEKLYKKKKAG